MANRRYNASHLGSTKKYQIQESMWYEISIGGLGEDFTFLVQNCTLPELSNPVIEVPFGNSTAKIAGKREVPSGSVSFYDAIVADMAQQILDWQSQIYDASTGAMGWVSEYKRDMSVTQYGPDGTMERVWQFEGVWPSSVNYGQMNSAQADKVMLQCTLEYDNAFREDVKPGTRAQSWGEGQLPH